MLPVEQPFKTYTGLDGKPLDKGYVYFGQPGQNPQTAPVTVFWDAACTIPAAQPLRTVNGYIIRGGAPANVFATGPYSETVLDSKKRQVFYAQNSDEFSVGQAAKELIDSMRERVSVKAFGAAGDGSDATQAFQDAVASLGGKPGTVYVPLGIYKITGKVSCVAGQSFVGEGAVLDVSEYNSVLLSYNEADTFSFANYYPPTLIQGFKLMGKVSIDAPNRNFIFAKINRTPYVTMRDCSLYYAAAAWVVDESILCTFDSIRCYNPISDCIAFGQTDLVNRFAPNGCTVINSHFEEQKYPCTGINVAAGTINVDNCYLESLSTLVRLSGGSVTITQTGLGLRYQAGSVGIQVDQAARLAVNECDLTFAGGWSATSMVGLNINADVQLTFNNNRVTGLFAAGEVATLAAVKGSVTGAINGNIIKQAGLGSTLTIFAAGDVQGASYGGTFEGNYVEGAAGTTTIFSAASAGLGVITPHIIGNKFSRVGAFDQLYKGLIAHNTFDGAADTISWLGEPGGILRDNVFYAAGWTVRGAAGEENNFGLYDASLSSSPYVSAYISALTPVPNNTPTKVVFNAEEYDTNACYDPTTGRFQPKVPGIYNVRALLAWYPASAGVTQSHIYKNGAPYIAGANNPDDSSGFAQSVQGSVYLNGGTDYVEIFATQTSGASLSLAADQLRATHLQIAFVRSLPA